jgi:REP element-mobilizing transposase RayT
VIASIILGMRNPKQVLHRDVLACEGVVQAISSLHGSRWRVLAYCLMPDHLHILILARDGSRLEFGELLQRRIAVRLRAFGYRRVWRKDVWNRLIPSDEDLAAAISDVLAKPVRARITWNWPTYPWSGSAEWPDIDGWFLGLRRGDRGFRSQLLNGYRET